MTVGDQFLAIADDDLDAPAALTDQFAAAGWQVVNGFELAPQPWAVDGVVCVGSIVDAESLADAMEVAARGASLAVTVIDGLVDAVFDDALRLEMVMWSDPDAGTDDAADVAADHVGDADQPEWAALLEQLIAGRSVSQAARACHLSLRSAYRRLGEARSALGAASNTAASVTWAARRRR